MLPLGHMSMSEGSGEAGADDAMWQALADPSRRLVLDLLKGGPATTGSIAARLEAERGLSRFAAMKHIGVLVEAGLVTIRREGRQRWNCLNAAPFVAMYRRWVSGFAALPADVLFGLKAHVEGKELP